MTGQSQHSADKVTPVEDIKAPSAKSFHRFIRSMLIVSLSVLCVIGGLLIYQLHARLDKARPILPMANIQVINHSKQPAVRHKNPLSSEIKTTTTEHETSVPLTEKNDTHSEMDKPSDEKKSEDNQIITENTLSDTVLPVVSSTEQSVSESAPYFTLQDALMLRDHLQAGESCRSDLKKLLTSQTPYHTWHTLIEQLTPVCAMDETSLNDMRSLFRKEYKRAVIAYYRMNNPWWLAYLKAVPATMVEIRRIQPTGNTPPDLLSHAQNALIRGDLKQTVNALKALPETMQAAFSEFMAQAELYLKAREEVERLVLSFEQKGK